MINMLYILKYIFIRIHKSLTELVKPIIPTNLL